MEKKKSNTELEGEAISINEVRLDIPDHPIIPYIRGDGIGVDITPVMIKVW